ncbi:MAG: hypothetical protein PHW01_01020 [Patescibacteria group bacterium]|nr:hypothetical protein [Patescibacteria group bacterium]
MNMLNFRIGVADAEIAVERNGQDMSIGRQGLIGTLPPNTKLDLVIRVPHKYHLESFCAHRDEEEEAPTFGLLQGLQEGNSITYRFPVSTIGKPPKGFTKWPKNQIYVVAKLGKGGFQFFQVSLASQDYRIYLRYQLLYSGEVVKQNGKPAIVNPYFAPWVGLDQVIIDRFKYQVLDEAPEYTHLTWDEVVDHKGSVNDDRHIPHYNYSEKLTNDGFGIVDYFTESKGVGCAVVRQGGELWCCKIHYSSLPPNGGFRTTKSTDSFIFKEIIEDGKEGWEVKGVELI